MRIRLAFTALVAIAAAQSAAAEPKVSVFCPAISFDVSEERAGNSPSDPRPVELMVVATAIREGDSNSRKAMVQLKIDRVLFGSLPPATLRIRLDDGYGDWLPDDADRVRYIYGLVCRSRERGIGYSFDGHYLYQRLYSLSDEKQAEALARARLDLQVLSSDLIFVGKPERQIGADAEEVLVERVLHGSIKPSERLLVRKEIRPIPLSGPGPLSISRAGATRTNKDVGRVRSMLDGQPRRFRPCSSR